MHSCLCWESFYKGIVLFSPGLIFCLVLHYQWTGNCSLFLHLFLQSNDHCLKHTLKRIGPNMKCLTWIFSKFPLKEWKICYCFPFTDKQKGDQGDSVICFGMHYFWAEIEILSYLTMKPAEFEYNCSPILIESVIIRRYDFFFWVALFEVEGVGGWVGIVS